METEQQTPEDILKAALLAQTQFERAEEARLQEALRQREKDLKTAKDAHAAREGAQKTLKEAYQRVTDIEARGDTVAPELAKAVADLEKAVADTAGLVKTTEEKITVAEQEPKLVSRLYEEADKENIKLDEAQKEKQHRQEVRDQMQRLREEYDGVTEDIKRLKNEVAGESLLQWFTIEDKIFNHIFAGDLNKMGGKLLNVGIYIRDADSGIINAFNYNKNITNTEQLSYVRQKIKEIRKHVGIFDRKIKKYLNAIEEALTPEVEEYARKQDELNEKYKRIAEIKEEAPKIIKQVPPGKLGNYFPNDDVLSSWYHNLQPPPYGYYRQ